MSMRDVLPALERWRQEGLGCAVATVVAVWGSAPRQPGAVLAVAEDGRFAGSVSGGCVEAAVIEAAIEARRSGRCRRLSFEVSDDEAWAVGLSCGGAIEVHVRPLPATADGHPVDAAVARAVREERALCQVLDLAVEDPGATWALTAAGEVVAAGGPAPEPALLAAARDALKRGESLRGSRLAAAGGEADPFFHVHLPRPQLLIVGGGHVAEHLVRLAAELDFRTVVIDPRAAFLDAERLAGADRCVQAWPAAALAEERLDAVTSVAVLSHDPRIDVPALQAALASDAGYVGVLGSRRTRERRERSLREAGVPVQDLERLHAPIGLDLGGRHPAEVALAILAQIVAVRHGRSER